MNEILQRIEEAAHQYTQSDAVAPENMQLAFGDFINGAKWALQNQWISVEKSLPKEEGDYNVMIEHDIYDSDGVFLRHEVSYDTYLYQPQYGGWESAINNVTHWMPIPSLKESEK